MIAPNFGEPPVEQLEPVDEVRLLPTATPSPVPLEPGELPLSYGRNRLVLLPVDPYLIHVYWDLASTVPPAAGARPILRFHESLPSEMASETQTRPFDVDVDFTTSSWYVNLWSPDKLYFANLGWRYEDGAFVELARSNTVRTPPAWPAPRATGATVPILTAPALVPEPATPRPDTAELLQRRLAELFAIRGELPPVHEPLAIPFELEDEMPGEPSQLDDPVPSPWTGLHGYDLTQLSEERFTPGISSDLEGSFGK